MAYIGKQPVVGNFQVCDAISVVNGQAAYTMQVASANVEPENANHMLVSLNGVLQKPGSSFTISGATITFASNLATGDVIDFIILLGDTLNVGTPSDDSVGAAQIKNDLISGTTALASEPADTDEFLVSDAGTLKRIDYSLIKGSGLVKLASTTLSGASAGIAFNSTYVNSTYDNYYLFINGILPVTDNADIGVYASVDNGSSFATILSGNHYLQLNGTGNGWQHSQNAHYVAHDCSNVAGEIKVSGYAIVENVNDTSAWKGIFGKGITQNSGTKTNDYSYVTLSTVSTTSAINYLMVKSNDGNLQGFGTVTLYGVVK